MSTFRGWFEQQVYGYVNAAPTNPVLTALPLPRPKFNDALQVYLHPGCGISPQAPPAGDVMVKAQCPLTVACVLENWGGGRGLIQ